MGGDHDERIGVRGGRLLGDGRSPVRVSGESCRTLQVIISTQKSFLAMCRIDAARDAIDLWAYVSCGMVQAGKYRDGVPGMYTVLRLYHVNVIIPRKLSKTSCVGLLKAFSLGGIETKHN